MSGNFGHQAINFGSTHIDSWGAGPFTLSVKGKRYYFTDSDMFGPLIESKHGEVLTRQPGEKHTFWDAYAMWRKSGRQGRKVGRWTVCKWRMPRPGTYWKDGRGISHILSDPDLFDGSLVQVPEPTKATP
jgi:hypothetical protein